MQFLNANGATFEAKELGSRAIPESEARRRASAEVPSLTAVQADSGLLTWPQHRLDHKEVWLVRLSQAEGAARTEYVFIDASSGSVIWKLGTER
jgi:hypothetical protein